MVKTKTGCDILDFTISAVLNKIFTFDNTYSVIALTMSVFVEEETSRR
jgi:hypothetical protein